MRNRLLPLLAALPASLFAATLMGAQPISEYAEIQDRLQTGWNTWNTRSVLTQVLLPEGFGVSLAFKQVRWIDEPYLREAMIGRTEDDSPRIRAGAHASDGRYTHLEIEWQNLRAVVESAHVDGDLVVLVEPIASPDQTVKLVVETAMYWNRPGALAKISDDHLKASFATSNVDVYSTASHQEDFYVQTSTPYLVIPLDGPIGLSTGSKRNIDQIRLAIATQRESLEDEASKHGNLADAYIAVQSGIAWNLIYEPREDRVVATAGRLWNEECGGYCLFGWDNFFLAYVTSLWSQDLAFANVLEHLRGATSEGFIPNDNRGNGSKSFDRSQPPVGSIMVREIYKKYPERWFLEEVFDPLLKWNRWWMSKRINDGLLSYGSHPTGNPFLEPSTQTEITARYESGMDDSPMYFGVPFDPETHTLALQDVGLTSLVIADSLALAEMAQELGRETEEIELRHRAATLAEQLDRLWDEEMGLYLNRRTDTGEFSRRLSPTLFYPLIPGVPSSTRIDRIVLNHLVNQEEFWGDWVLPSIARTDPDFPKQRYWRGAIWPPLNFLTYIGLRHAEKSIVATSLAKKSLELFLGEWRRQGYVSENYSSTTGKGDGDRLSRDRFHSWGTLMAIMAFIESGSLPAPEDSLIPQPKEESDSPTELPYDPYADY